MYTVAFASHDADPAYFEWTVYCAETGIEVCTTTDTSLVTRLLALPARALQATRVAAEKRKVAA